MYRFCDNVVLLTNNNIYIIYCGQVLIWWEIQCCEMMVIFFWILSTGFPDKHKGKPIGRVFCLGLDFRFIAWQLWAREMIIFLYHIHKSVNYSDDLFDNLFNVKQRYNHRGSGLRGFGFSRCCLHCRVVLACSSIDKEKELHRPAWLRILPLCVLYPWSTHSQLQWNEINHCDMVDHWYTFSLKSSDKLTLMTWENTNNTLAFECDNDRNTHNPLGWKELINPIICFCSSVSKKFGIKLEIHFDWIRC